MPAWLTSLPIQIGLREHLPDLRLAPQVAHPQCGARLRSTRGRSAVCDLPARAISNMDSTTATSAGRGVRVPEPSAFSNPYRRGPPFTRPAAAEVSHAATGAVRAVASDSRPGDHLIQCGLDLVALVLPRPDLPAVDDDARRGQLAQVDELPPLRLLAAGEPILRVSPDRLDLARLRSSRTTRAPPGRSKMLTLNAETPSSWMTTSSASG